MIDVGEVVGVSEGDQGLMTLDVDHGMLTLGKYFEITPAGLKVKGHPSLEVCGDLVRFLQTMESSIELGIGDASNFIESAFGEEGSQLFDASDGWSEETLRNYRWVSGKVPPQNRLLPPLKFRHLREVAHIDDVAEQRAWLDKAVEGDGDGEPWNGARLSKEIKASAKSAGKVSFSVTVECEDKADVEALCRQLLSLGRTAYRANLGNE